MLFRPRRSQRRGAGERGGAGNVDRCRTEVEASEPKAAELE